MWECNEASNRPQSHTPERFRPNSDHRDFRKWPMKQMLAGGKKQLPCSTNIDETRLANALVVAVVVCAWLVQSLLSMLQGHYFAHEKHHFE